MLQVFQEPLSTMVDNQTNTLVINENLVDLFLDFTLYLLLGDNNRQPS